VLGTEFSKIRFPNIEGLDVAYGLVQSATVLTVVLQKGCDTASSFSTHFTGVDNTEAECKLFLTGSDLMFKFSPIGIVESGLRGLIEGANKGFCCLSNVSCGFWKLAVGEFFKRIKLFPNSGFLLVIFPGKTESGEGEAKGDFESRVDELFKLSLVV